MTNIDRRSLLTRGAIGGAALTLTGGAALASIGDDAEVIRLGNGCLGHIAEVARLAKPKKAAYRKVWAAVKRLPRWRVMGIEQNPFDLVWHARASDFNQKVENRSFPLSAKTEKAAALEMIELDRQMDREKRTKMPLETTLRSFGGSRICRTRLWPTSCARRGHEAPQPPFGHDWHSSRYDCNPRSRTSSRREKQSL
jgi:hypothetical protein